MVTESKSPHIPKDKFGPRRIDYFLMAAFLVAILIAMVGALATSGLFPLK